MRKRAIDGTKIITSPTMTKVIVSTSKRAERLRIRGGKAKRMAPA